MTNVTMRTALLIPLLLSPSIASAQNPQLGRQDPQVVQGIKEMQSGNGKAAIATLDTALRANPDDYVAWYYLGLAQHGAGQLDVALRSHMLAASLTPPGNALGQNALYNAACAHALLGRPDRAFLYLHKARNNGFANIGTLKNDTDLASLRKDERFIAFLANPSIRPADPATEVESLTAIVDGQTGGVEIAADGTLYVADFASKVWRVAQDGSMDVLAEGFTKAADCTLDSEGHLLQVDHGTSKVWRIAPDGTKIDLGIANLNGPVGIDSAPDGTLYITSYRGNAILRVTPEGERQVVTEGGLLSGPNGVALAPDGRLFVVNFNDGALIEVNAEGEQRLVAFLPGGGNGHIAWSSGELLMTARRGNKLYRVSTLGEITLVAGLGGQGIRDGDPGKALFGLPNGIAVSADGSTAYVNDRVSSPKAQWVLRRVTLQRD